MSSSRRGPVVFLVRLAIFAVLCVGVGEVWFRTVTPACDVPMYYEDPEWKIIRYDPTGPAEGLHTVGRLAKRGGHWRVNNAGWNSSIDYLPATERSRPLVALLGDSYIEGLLSDVDKHVDVYLSDALGGAVDAYSFALSGWYLEQHVAVSRYVSATYSPALLVVFLGRNDVVNSVRENSVVSGRYWQIGSSEGQFTEIAPTETYVAGRLARPARLSALLNYLRYNAKIVLPGMRRAAVAQEPGSGEPAGNGTGSSSAADAWKELLPAADYMVDRLCAEHPGVPIIFAARGDRYLPIEDIAGTPLFADARAVQEACQGRRDCYLFDLRPAFSEDWAANHILFEAADGSHWNAYANRVVAGALAAFIEQNNLLGNIAQAGLPR